MKRMMQLLVALPVFSLTLIVAMAHAQAQQAPAAPTPAKGSSDHHFVLSQQQIDEMKKEGDAYAATHPPPQPGNTTICYQTSKPYPDQYVCIPDTWWPDFPKPPEDGHCYSNPDNRTEVRCVPTREQLLQATQDGY